MSWFPRPSSPRAVWADIKSFTGERRPHQWVGLGIAIGMPAIIIAGFWHDASHGIAPPPQLIYAESWPATRTDEEIKAQQKIDQAKREAMMKERQRQLQKVEQGLKKVGL
jgi:hypothetical protein